jgi:hypothetical protein
MALWQAEGHWRASVTLPVREQADWSLKTLPNNLVFVLYVRFSDIAGA